MADGDSLLEVAAAVADGKAVDWDAADRLAASEADRSVLAELRFIAAVAREPNPGTTDPERWGPLRVIERVRSGTFGDIYRAWDSRLDREVALKVLRLRDHEEEQTSTAIQEGRLLARVRHPNVVTVYGAERIEGRVGVWMEYIHGKTLEEVLTQQGRLELDRVVTIGVELGGALATVHRAGVIHRDVKAQNVMVDSEGRLVLTDFGAGTELDEGTDSDARELAGTPLYAAPEVLAGQPATPKSDVYSLGVLLYHVLTGTYPVMARSLKEVRNAHAAGRRVPLNQVRPDLPDEFVAIIDRALHQDPLHRYATADAFADELARFASADNRGPRLGATSRRGQLAAATFALAIVSVGAFAVWRVRATPTITATANNGQSPLGSSFTVIDFPDSTRTDLFAVNDHGTIVGSYIDRSDVTHGFRLSDGRFAPIDVPGAARTRPTGLNNDGAIVGDFDDSGGTAHGFLLREGKLSVIDAPGATYTRAESITNAGDIVGDYIDAKGIAHGFLLSGGVYSDIDVPGSNRTRAIRVNDVGDIVGDYRDSKDVSHGFLLKNGQFTSIDVPAALVTQAFGINIAGAIVGGYGFPSRHGFLLRDGQFTPIDMPGAFQTVALSINSSGVIVGAYLSGTPSKTRGFMLTP